jgi:membrane-bound lytic murein transglycosylase B
VADAESALTERRADLAAAQAILDSIGPELEGAQAKVAQAVSSLVQADDALPALVAADARLAAASRMRTTPVAYPPPAGHAVSDDAMRAYRALADARRGRAEAAAALDAARGNLTRAQLRTEEARRRVADLTAEIDQRANALAGLRQQLAVSDGPTPSGTTFVGVLTTEGGEAAQPSPLAVSDIPAAYLDLYRHSAAACPGLSWTVLAAIGAIESSHGRSTAPGVHSGANFAGAKGPMQFLDETWAAYGSDGNTDGTKDVYEPSDAVAGAAAYLCANGAGQLVTLAGAIWDYNHADWYVAAVIQLAAAYGGAG